MKVWLHHKFLFVAIFAYAILWLVLHPSLGFLLDSDAVAYLSIARRVAVGEWLKSVNGLWSPLNSWLLVPFIKMGIDSWLASKVLNFFFGAVLLVQSYLLFERLKFEHWIRNVFTTILVVVICFFLYYQMFGDVLQLIFALAYVHLFIQKDFVLNSKKVILAGLIMGLGFYAKSYSLVFFMSHFLVLCLLAWKKNTTYRKAIFINYILGIVVAISVVLPWSFQLQQKYGEFSLTGFAGKLNMSWYINSGKTFKDDIKLLVPPPYDDSPTFWEDPYRSAGELSTPFSSAHHFKRWVLRVGHTCLMALICVSEITIFFIPIVLIYLARLFRKRKFKEDILKMFLALLILPLGYLAMHIETRYIWLSTFLIISLGVHLINLLEWRVTTKKLATVIFAISFLLFPISQFFFLHGKNKNLFKLADELKAKNVSGKIVTNHNDEGSFWVVSYLANLNNYTIEQDVFDNQLLLQEMKRYGIENYFYFPRESAQFNNDSTFLAQNFDAVLTTQHKNVLYKLKN